MEPPATACWAAVCADLPLAPAADVPASQTGSAQLSGTWRLLWTTEKETLFILKNASWFGTQAGEVYQVCQWGTCWRGRVQSISAGSILHRGHGFTPPHTPTPCAQVIDVPSSTLQNVILFPPEGAFIVDATISTEGPQRTQFQFSSATLKLPNRSLKLPPFGKGWCVRAGSGSTRCNVSFGDLPRGGACACVAVFGADRRPWHAPVVSCVGLTRFTLMKRSGSQRTAGATLSWWPGMARLGNSEQGQSSFVQGLGWLPRGVIQPTSSSSSRIL